jgi:hypothetical protein
MRWNRKSSRLMLLAFPALLVVAGTGCGSGAVAAPSGEAARTALELALKTWRDGGKPGELSGSKPAVVVHDTPWSQGGRLKSFEILREEEGSEVEKRFTVRLSLSKPEVDQEVGYHVLGVGPLMVFRDQDYQRNINMEDGPKLNRPGRQTRRSRK